MATEDPIHDDGFRFVERLLNNGVDVKVKEYCNHTHGFLSFDCPGGIKWVRKSVLHGVEYILELFEKAGSPSSPFLAGNDEIRAEETAQ